MAPLTLRFFEIMRMRKNPMVAVAGIMGRETDLDTLAALGLTGEYQERGPSSCQYMKDSVPDPMKTAAVITIGATGSPCDAARSIARAPDFDHR